VLTNLWNRLVGRTKTDASEHEAEREGPESPAERRFAHESFEDRQGDSVVGERLGGIDSGRLLGDDRPPPGGVGGV
jgi:hypothetical protein